MNVQEQAGAVVVTVVEDQCATIWKLVEPHIAAGRTRVVLDFSQVGFLNSVNIAAVISTRNRVVAAGGQVLVAEVKERVKAVFRVLKLERLFNLDLGLAEALTV